MSNLEPFDFIKVWGDIGQLKGYTSGLRRRINFASLPVVEEDLEHQLRIIARMERHLNDALKYDK